MRSALVAVRWAYLMAVGLHHDRGFLYDSSQWMHVRCSSSAQGMSSGREEQHVIGDPIANALGRLEPAAR